MMYLQIFFWFLEMARAAVFIFEVQEKAKLDDSKGKTQRLPVNNSEVAYVCFTNFFWCGLC